MQIEEDGVHVLFACSCMTFDESVTKFWYHGEYEALDLSTMHDKLDAHDLHCPFKSSFTMYALPSNEIIYQGTTEDYR